VIVPRRSSRPGSVDDTRRVPVVDFAPTRMFRDARQVRTPVWSPTVISIDPDTPASDLAHPRLVRRTRPPTPAPDAPARPASRPPADFEDEPTKQRG
jgi:hypothetical protein